MDMEPTPPDVAFSTWQVYYFRLASSAFIGDAISAEPLLLGWWQYFPTIQRLYLVVSILQIIFSMAGLALMGFVIYRRKHSQDAILHDSKQNYALHILLVSKPILTLVWQTLLGFIGITTSQIWLSSPTATFIFLHAWVEVTILVLSIIVLAKPFVPLSTLYKTQYSLIAIVGVLSIIFMCMGDIYWKASWGGVALPADIGNLITNIVIPFYLKKRDYYQKNEYLSYILWSEFALFTTHFLVFYPQIIPAIVGGFEGIRIAGSLLASFATLNLLPLLWQIFLSIRLLQWTDQIPFQDFNRFD